MTSPSASSWKIGVAFVKGINMFGHRRIDTKTMLALAKSIEDDHVRVLRVVRCDNIIFQKRAIHYATVGRRLEACLCRHFGTDVHVTCRSGSVVMAVAEYVHAMERS